MEGRDLGDSQILSTTVREQEGSKVRFKTTLPSGRDLVSEYMNPDDANGKVMIKWCEHVRTQVDVDQAEVDAVKKRESISVEDETDHEVVAGEVEQVEPDPIQFAITQRDAYRQRVQVLETRINDAKVERKVMRTHYEQWEKVVETLRGETDDV